MPRANFSKFLPTDWKNFLTLFAQRNWCLHYTDVWCVTSLKLFWKWVCRLEPVFSSPSSWFVIFFFISSNFISIASRDHHLFTQVIYWDEENFNHSDSKRFSFSHHKLIVAREMYNRCVWSCFFAFCLVSFLILSIFFSLKLFIQMREEKLVEWIMNHSWVRVLSHVLILTVECLFSNSFMKDKLKSNQNSI
jgi:hypothetical protein